VKKEDQIGKRRSN